MGMACRRVKKRARKNKLRTAGRIPETTNLSMHTNNMHDIKLGNASSSNSLPHLQTYQSGHHGRPDWDVNIMMAFQQVQHLSAQTCYAKTAKRQLCSTGHAWQYTPRSGDAGTREYCWTMHITHVNQTTSCLLLTNRQQPAYRQPPRVFGLPQFLLLNE